MVEVEVKTIDFNINENKLTAEEKDLLSLIASSLKGEGIADLRDLVSKGMDRMIKQCKSTGSAVRYASLDSFMFNQVDARSSEATKYRNLNEILRPAYFADFKFQVTDKFFSNKYIITSGDMKGTKFGKPKDESLGESVYGAVLSFISDYKMSFSLMSKKKNVTPGILKIQFSEYEMDPDYSRGWIIRKELTIEIHSDGNVTGQTNTVSEEQIIDQNLHLEEDLEQNEIDEEIDDYGDLDR